MKISPKQYAAALFEAVDGKGKNDAEKSVAEFARVLRENRDLKKVKDIALEFEKIWNKAHGITELTVITAAKLGDASEKNLKESIKTVFGAKSVDVKNLEDKDILGGVVFKYGDVVLDASLRTRLERLKGEMKK